MKCWPRLERINTCSYTAFAHVCVEFQPSTFDLQETSVWIRIWSAPTPKQTARASHLRTKHSQHDGFSGRKAILYTRSLEQRCQLLMIQSYRYTESLCKASVIRARSYYLANICYIKGNNRWNVSEMIILYINTLHNNNERKCLNTGVFLFDAPNCYYQHIRIG